MIPQPLVPKKSGVAEPLPNAVLTVFGNGSATPDY